MVNITECLGRTMSDFGFILPDDNTKDNQCFDQAYSQQFGIATFQFNFSSTTNNCEAQTFMNSTHLTYGVPVWFQYNSTYDRVILYNDIIVNYTCPFPRFLNATLDVGLYPITSPDRLTVVRFGTYILTMQLFKYSNFTGPYTVSDLPIQIKVGTPLYIGASIMGPDPQLFSMKIDSCYVTPRSDPNDPIKYNVISDGCPVSWFNSIHFIRDGEGLVAYFSMNAFRIGRYSQVHLHCTFSLCAGICPTSCTGIR
ncbi:uromodulin-like [Protopterus annectens]|uniref:uromodulin-like n=1 Tax=Protopterus annectens TaxID=7888 RepID=UPI001CFAAB3E|nr:uromodulin-like [Protopterus annectens]